MEMKGEINVLETISEEKLNDFVLRSGKDWRFTVLLTIGDRGGENAAEENGS